jgi:small subunit ribosomal protein S14
MAKKSIIAREAKRRRMVAKYADLRKQLKEEGKWDELDKLPKNSSAVRLHNRCELTWRPNGYMRKFKICRVMLRKMANEGKIPGVTKASW